MYLFFCNRFYKTTDPVLPAANRAFRYGEGVFETMKVVNGVLLFSEAHFNRLARAAACLHLSVPRLLTPAFLTQKITELARKNGHAAAARIRLTVWRGSGGLYEVDADGFEYCIESYALEQPQYTLNENGLVTDIFDAAHKTTDAVSNYKTANHLVYAMAARHAKANRLNDCFVLNTNGNICDSTIANVFTIKDGRICTPPLTEGGVDGIMRRHLLNGFERAGFTAVEQPITAAELTEADEIFTTNVIKGIRWVAMLGEWRFGNTLIRRIHDSMLASL